MKKLKAFTLAEVLIVMGIIGVLAILTVPNMLSNVDAKKRSTSFKKAYNTLSNIYSSYFVGAVQKPMVSSTDNTNNLFIALLDKLSIDYYYQNSDNVATAAKAYTTTLATAASRTTGTNGNMTSNTDFANTWIKTTDGMAYLIGNPGDDGNTRCKSRLEVNDMGTLGLAQTGGTGTCMWVTVDYNGQKAPNVHCATGNVGVIEAANTTITDAEIEDLANCDRITFLLSATGFTPGNPDSTVAGKIIGSDN